jgi:hypothetical protein
VQQAHALICRSLNKGGGVFAALEHFRRGFFFGEIAAQIG